MNSKLQIKDKAMATQVLNFADYERTDYENMANELADMEALSQKEALRVQIDSEIGKCLKGS